MAYKDKEKEKIARQRAKQAYYERHKNSERRKARERIDKRRRLAYEYVDAVKETSPCTDCEINYPAICMDFDHISGDKVANISCLINLGRPLEVIKAEIKKCELVCANCHRIRTRNRYSP